MCQKLFQALKIKTKQSPSNLALVNLHPLGAFTLCCL